MTGVAVAVNQQANRFELLGQLTLEFSLRSRIRSALTKDADCREVLCPSSDINIGEFVG